MYTAKKLSKHRAWTYHLLRRFKKFHCPISLVCEFDVTDLLERIENERSKGRRVGLTACVAKATAMTIKEHPELNNRLFQGLFSVIEATYDHITCGMAAERETESGEKVVFPLVIKNIDRLSVDDIHQLIKDTKTKPLGELEGYQKVSKISGLPRFLIPFIHFLYRSNPRYTAKDFSTYGLSSTIVVGGTGVGGHAPANQTTFFPGSLRKCVLPVNDEIAIRSVLTLAITAEHYLVDGLSVQRASLTLRQYLEDPTKLLGE